MRDIAKANEVQLEHHRRLTLQWSGINQAVRDGYQHVVPSLDRRRAAFEKDYVVRSRAVDERYDLIDSSRGEAVAFAEMGTETSGSPERGRAVAARKWQSAVSKLEGMDAAVAADGGGNNKGAPGAGGARTGTGRGWGGVRRGVLDVVKQAHARDPNTKAGAEADVTGRARRKGTSGSPERGRAVAARKWQSAVSELKGMDAAVAADGGGNNQGAPGAGGARTGTGRGWGGVRRGVLDVVKQARVRDPNSNTKAGAEVDVTGRARRKGSLFHDGKATAALARVQERRDVEAAREETRAAVQRVHDDATQRERAAEERRVHEEKEPGRLAQPRAALRQAGSTVMMGSRVATAVDDNSTEGTAARDAEHLAVAAIANVAATAAVLEDLVAKADEASARLEASREKLAEAEVAAAAAGGFAARAEEIVAELREGGQDDAAECAVRTVEAWRARADVIAADAHALRRDCDALEDATEALHGQTAAAVHPEPLTLNPTP